MTQTTEELKAEDLTLEVARLFPRQGEWTEEDYFSLPETNKIVELSEGRLIITPSPTDRHQSISGNLFSLIRNYVRLNDLGEVRYSPLDVWLYEGTIRQPDIIFMSNEHRDRITDRYWIVPDLVVEIISEGTERQDRVYKFREYQKAGIPEYWIVEPFQNTIEIFTLEDGIYVQLGKWSTGETVYSKVLDGFQIVVDNVFDVKD